MLSRVMRMLAGAGVIAAALFGHVWTRGDVALGLFGGKSCGGVRCETSSWSSMGVADHMTIASTALLLVGLATLVAAVIGAVAIVRGAVHATGVVAIRALLALTAVSGAWFFYRCCTAFNRTPPIGAGIAILGAGIVLVWTALAPPPEARVTDTSSR